jgi:hypothetical protein
MVCKGHLLTCVCCSCFHAPAGAVASAVLSAEASLPAIDVEELPVALRQLQGDDLGDDLSHVVNKASHATDAVKDIASTKVSASGSSQQAMLWYGLYSNHRYPQARTVCF